MITTLSWILILARREVVRKPRRSMITIVVIAIGMITIIFIRALNAGFSKQLVSTYVNLSTGHIAITEQDYYVNDTVDKFIPDPDSIVRLLEEEEQVMMITRRVRSYGLLCSKEGCSNIMALGICPFTEISANIIREAIVEGEYFQDSQVDSQIVLIGSGLARLLMIKPNSNVGLIVKPLKGAVNVMNFVVGGIFETHIPEIDNFLVYIPMKRAQELLGYDNQVSEIIVLVRSLDRIESVATIIRDRIESKEMDVMKWNEIAPQIAQLIDLNKFTMRIILYIIFMVVAISAMNVQLISIVERMAEFGIIMAIGAKRYCLMFLILIESIITSLLGIISGSLIGYGMIAFLAKRGIDLGIFERGFSSFIGGTVLYPVIGFRNILESNVAFLSLSVLVSLYPGVKAAMLLPVRMIKS